MGSLRGNLTAAHTYLMGRGREDRDRISSEANRKDSKRKHKMCNMGNFG